MQAVLGCSLGCCSLGCACFWPDCKPGQQCADALLVPRSCVDHHAAPDHHGRADQHPAPDHHGVSDHDAAPDHHGVNDHDTAGHHDRGAHHLPGCGHVRLAWPSSAACIFPGRGATLGSSARKYHLWVLVTPVWIARFLSERGTTPLSAAVTTAPRATTPSAPITMPRLTTSTAQAHTLVVFFSGCNCKACR